MKQPLSCWLAMVRSLLWRMAYLQGVYCHVIDKPSAVA